MRYFLYISYLGTNYHGWQIQKNAHSIQYELNNCLSTLFGVEVKTFGAGRTDTGVHAINQVVHFDYTAGIDYPICNKITTAFLETLWHMGYYGSNILFLGINI